jgi:hypothetical protein
MWAVGRAGSLEWFQFGTPRIVHNFRGGSKEVGEYALHLDCPWQLLGPAGLVIATDQSEPELLSHVGSQTLVCEKVSGSEDGGASLQFAGGWLLVVEPGDPDDLEYWRLFRPGTEGPHVVVGPVRVEE